MPEGSDITSIRDNVLNDYDVGYLPGVNFSPDGSSGQNYARLCFGYNQPSEVYEGIARLAEAFENEGAF
jgi:DNA-binding transcriptional MocR family regulator